MPGALPSPALSFRRRSVLALGALALPVVLTGCYPLSSGSRGSRWNDKRFADFTEHVPTPITPSTGVHQLVEYMPGLRVTGGHYVAQAQQQPRELLPSPDRPTWTHAVLEVETADAQSLESASEGIAELLPPLYPPLRQFVPQDAEFKQVPAADADRLLRVTEAQLKASEVGLRTDQLAVCAGQRLVVLTGMLYRQ